MRRDLAVISPQTLDHRVASSGNDDEIARLALTLNDTLARLESFTDRQQRFVADASHELQSPLASSIAELELALAEPEQCDWPATASDLLTEQQRMTRLVQDLLFLARDDDGANDAPQTLLDLDDVVRSEAARLRSRTTVPIDTSAVAPVEVRGGADQLARVVRNLLENAVRYAATRVTVTLTTDDRDDRRVAVLTVADDGPGVPVAARDRIFERFGRADESRARGTGGTGLGLSIARRVAERHGGAITLDPSDAATRFVLVLPLPSADRIGR
jgi:signal transduction histidine kinase